MIATASRAGAIAHVSPSPSRPSIHRIVAFPRVGPPYVELLYDALERAGVKCEAGDWSGRLMLSELRRGDLVHLHWPSFAYYDPDSLLGTWRRLARFIGILTLVRYRGASIAWTAHNLYPHDGAARLAVHRLARRALVRLANKIYVHGEAAGALVRGEFDVPPQKLVVIHHGNLIGRYPDAISRDEARRQLSIPPNAYVHLFFGSCRPYKNLLGLVAAFRELPHASDTRLIIAGGFPSEDYLRSVTVAAADDRRITVHPGFIADDRLQIYLRAADSVVLPYAEVLTSGATVLALSFGKPVVAPAIGSLVDYVPIDCGILYQPSEPNALTHAMAAMQSKRFSEDRVRRWIEGFTWDGVATTMIKYADRAQSHKP